VLRGHGPYKAFSQARIEFPEADWERARAIPQLCHPEARVLCGLKDLSLLCSVPPPKSCKFFHHSPETNAGVSSRSANLPHAGKHPR
jgi:hypothetical protein